MPYTEEPTGSPATNLNKGYAGQEKKDLLNDNPIARDASGGRPMILKHMSGSRMGGSPLMTKEGHGDAEFSENHLPSGLHIDEIEPKMSMSKKMTEKPKKEA